jgi:hypothetical protein
LLRAACTSPANLLDLLKEVEWYEAGKGRLTRLTATALAVVADVARVYRISEQSCLPGVQRNGDSSVGGRRA